MRAEPFDKLRASLVEGRAVPFDRLRAQKEAPETTHRPTPNVPPWLTPTLRGRRAGGVTQQRWTTVRAAART
jgi:hypothetical protein